MEKVLGGASREVFAFIGQHWKNLVLMSVIPVISQIAISYWQIHKMAGLYRSIGEIAPGSNPEAVFMANYFNSMGWSFLGSILVFFLMAMLFSQIVRYRKGAAASLLPVDAPSWKAAAITAVYAIGIALLTLVAYICVGLAVIIVGAILGALASMSGTVGAVIGALLIFVAVIGLAAFLLWFFFRFAVGLPGVALGHSPDFFKDMWSLSKGESWGVPLRMLLATIIIYIPLAIVMFAVMMPAFTDLANSGGFKPDPTNPLAMMASMANIFERMAPVSVITGIMLMPYHWFAILLLAISFDRLLARVPKATKV
jgi:hypothetical protein